MEIELIICGLIAITFMILDLSRIKDIKSMIKHYDELIHYLEKKVDEKDEINLIQLRRIYSIVGDTFHYLHYMFEKEPSKYIPLITELGSYLRRMYISSTPLSTLSDKYDLNPEERHLPCLDEDENRQMLAFLKEIKDEERTPVDLLRLIEELTIPENTFKEAFIRTKSLSIK